METKSAVGAMGGIDQSLAPRTADLPDFLPTLTEAPDFTSAAAFALFELALLAGAERGGLFVIDEASESLVLIAHTSGGELANAAILSQEARDATELPTQLPLADLSHPLITVALSLHAAQSVEESPEQSRLPYHRWLALPLVRTDAGAPPLLPAYHAAEVIAARGGRLLEAEIRLGQAPAGVVLLDAEHLDARAIPRLVRLAALAGPVLARFGVLHAAQQEIEELRESRDRLMLMMNALPDPIVITDTANNMLVQNRRAEHLLAAGETDSAGRRRALELNNLLFTSGLARAVMSAGARAESRELNLVDPDEGADLLFELLAHPLGDGLEPQGPVLSILRDVTDLRRASDELHRQVQRVRQAEVQATKERDRLNLILENVGDPILVTDDQAKIILMNDRAEQLFEIGGPVKAAYDYTAYEHSARQAAFNNDTKFSTFISEFALSPVRSRHERMTLIRPDDGREIPMEVVSGKIRNERGEAVAIVSVLHDLTKQVENERLYGELKTFSAQLEARVRAATADLEARNRQLQWQSQAVEKANRLKSDFLASMSHELRTPINAIVGHSALISDQIYGPVNERQSDALRRIRNAAQDLLALINDILDLARIEAGKMPLHVEPVDVRQLLTELEQQMEPLVQKKALSLSVDVSHGCPLMETDRAKVKQVLVNLLSNAVKFTPKGGIVVTAQPGEHTIEFTVRDTGVGIKAEDLDVIWEDFRQVDQSKTREAGGTGLGLGIVRKLLVPLKGTASVVSQFGQGSTFIVTLPLRLDPGDEAMPELFETKPGT
jgi:signal transduction histidine kinase